MTLTERKRVGGARQHVVGAEVAPFAERPLVADRRLVNRRLRQLRPELDAAGRAATSRRQRPTSGIGRIDDDLVDLVRAVDAHGLLVDARIEPVVEDAVAAAHVALASAQVNAARGARFHLSSMMRLHFLTEAEADVDVLAHAEIVLDDTSPPRTASS